MPTVLIEGYRFRFYSSDMHEPPHVHVIRGECVAKIWLEPVQLDFSRGYNRAALNRILKLTQSHRDRLLGAWHEYFSR
jgi:hypothetical protein